MPAKFANNHDSYIKNYLTTDKSKIINKTRILVGLHKTGYIFPFNIFLKVT